MYDDAPNINNFLTPPNLISSSRHPIFNLNGFANGKGDFLSADDLKGKTCEEKSFNGATNIQIYQWYQDQKLQEAAKGTAYKRRRYWGEPVDCSSHNQITKENHLYSQHLNKQYLTRGLKDEVIFNVEFSTKPQNQSKPNQMNALGKPLVSSGPSSQDKKPQSIVAQPIKDLKEFEFFQKQRSLFYSDQHKAQALNQDSEQDRKLKSILRHLKF